MPGLLHVCLKCVPLLEKCNRALETVSSDVTYCHLEGEQKGGGIVFLKHWMRVSVCDFLIPAMKETALVQAYYSQTLNILSRPDLNTTPACMLFLTVA